jgi:hypothetical protein
VGGRSDTKFRVQVSIIQARECRDRI